MTCIHPAAKRFHQWKQDNTINGTKGEQNFARTIHGSRFTIGGTKSAKRNLTRTLFETFHVSNSTDKTDWMDYRRRSLSIGMRNVGIVVGVVGGGAAGGVDIVLGTGEAEKRPEAESESS
ncbi:hypothetical protein H6P81_009564 [Aristolochia fimbriata]|uniref:Uncharacterized protein n=1 Tax=Aristolochia fimbriata TaxID=158543 RepID=A0AAV7ELU2_ARIFI|nr:hypothetical protein H6P81_009564 [Aristolochia fimbriata]